MDAWALKPMPRTGYTPDLSRSPAPPSAPSGAPFEAAARRLRVRVWNGGAQKLGSLQRFPRCDLRPERAHLGERRRHVERDDAAVFDHLPARDKHI